MKRVCKQCGKTFELSGSEIAFYKNKNLNLPKRCKACREANKQSRDVSEAQDWSIQKPGTDAPERNQSIQRLGNNMPERHNMPGRQENKVGKWVYVLIAVSVLFLFGLIGVSNHFFKEDSADPTVMVENGNDSSNVLAGDGSADAGEPLPENTAAAEELSQENAADAEVMPQEKAADVEEMPQEEAADAEDMTQSETAGIEEAAPLQDADEAVQDEVDVEKQYTFRNNKLLQEHFEKHGQEMGFSSAEEYQAAANAVVNNAGALHKTEKEDGDDVYYLEATNEFVIVSTDGYIRTYFYPNAGIDYYNRQ